MRVRRVNEVEASRNLQKEVLSEARSRLVYIDRSIQCQIKSGITIYHVIVFYYIIDLVRYGFE